MARTLIRRLCAAVSRWAGIDWRTNPSLTVDDCPDDTTAPDRSYNEPAPHVAAPARAATELDRSSSAALLRSFDALDRTTLGTDPTTPDYWRHVDNRQEPSC